MGNIILDIQRQYFLLLKKHLHGAWDAFRTSGQTPEAFAKSRLANVGTEIVIPGKSAGVVSATEHGVRALLRDVEAFWHDHGEPLHDAIRGGEMLVTQIGDLNATPDRYDSLARRLGIYFDTVCAIDPLAVAAQRLAADGSDVGSNGLIVRGIYDYLQVRALEPVVAETGNTPALVFGPPARIRWSDETFLRLRAHSEKKARAALSQCLGQEVGSAGDLARCAVDGRFVQDFAEVMSHELIPQELRGRSIDALARSADFQLPAHPRYSRLRPEVKAISFLHGAIQGEFLALYGAEVSASGMGVDVAVPPHLWALNRFRQSDDAEFFIRQGLRDEEVATAAIVSTDFSWLEATTVADLVELRRTGGLSTLRDALRDERRVLQAATPATIDAAAQRFVQRTSDLMARHALDLRLAQSDRPHWSKHLTPLGINAAVGLAASQLGSHVHNSVELLVALLVPTKTAFDVISDFRRERTRLTALKRNPLTHLLKMKQAAALNEMMPP